MTRAVWNIEATEVYRAFVQYQRFGVLGDEVRGPYGTKGAAAGARTKLEKQVSDWLNCKVLLSGVEKSKVDWSDAEVEWADGSD